MKSIIYLLLANIALFQAYAQDPITVSGTCSDTAALGQYEYIEKVNGKPSYRKGPSNSFDQDCDQFTSDSECSAYIGKNTYSITWSGTEWEWSYIKYGNYNPCIWLVQLCVPKSVSGTPDDPIPIVIARNSEDTQMPPCVNWVSTNEGCIPTITTCEPITGTAVKWELGETSIYPNPTSGNFLINLGQVYNSGAIKISNIEGELIKEDSFSNAKTIDLNIEEPAGIYFVNIKAEGMNVTMKLIKE